MLEVARAVSGWAEIKRKLDGGERLDEIEMRFARFMAIDVPAELRPPGWEIDDPNDPEYRRMGTPLGPGRSVEGTPLSVMAGVEVPVQAEPLQGQQAVDLETVDPDTLDDPFVAAEARALQALDVGEQVEAADVTDDELRECVAAIRAGQAVDLPGVDEEFALAVVRYANGLPPADSYYGAAVWEATRHAVEGDNPEQDVSDEVAFADGALRSVTFATEILLAASLPDLVERVGALIGIALVTSEDGWATGLRTKQDLNHAAEVALAILANPEGAAGSRALHAMFSEASRRAGERGISGEESLSGWLLTDSEVSVIAERLAVLERYENLAEQMREASS